MTVHVWPGLMGETLPCCGRRVSDLPAGDTMGAGEHVDCPPAVIARLRTQLDEARGQIDAVAAAAGLVAPYSPRDLVGYVKRMRERRDELAGICHRAHEAAAMRPEQRWSDIPAVVAFHRARSEGGAP